MQASGTDRISIDTRRFTPDKRLAAFRDRYAETLIPTRIEPIAGRPIAARLDAAGFGATRIAAVTSTATRWLTERADLERTPPGVMLDLLLEGHYCFRQGRRTAMSNAGDGVLVNTHRPSLAVAPVTTVSRSILIPAADLARLVDDPERLGGMPLGAGLPEIRLLRHYLAAVDLAGPPPDGALAAAVGRHVADLVIAAAARVLRLEDPGHGRGAKAARMAALKRLVAENLGQVSFSLTRAARRLGVSERCVQKMMEEEGVTFSAHVQEQRLLAARRILVDGEAPGLTVAAVALSVGFADASHFTRLFRRRFGETPAAARRSGGGRTLA